MTFLFICSNIPAAPPCGVYISQLIRYSKVCGSYQYFLDRGMLLTRKLLNQGFILVTLSSLRKFYGRHHEMVNRYGICVTNDHGYVPLVVSTFQSFRHSVVFYRSLFVLSPFSFGHCIICPSIYGF